MHESNQRLTEQRRKKAELLPQIAELAAEGQGSRQIARTLGVPKSTINVWLKQLWSQGESRQSPEVRAVIARHVARYEEIYDRAMEAWKLSQESKVASEEEEESEKPAEMSDGEDEKENEKPAAEKTDGKDEPQRKFRPNCRTSDNAYLRKAMDALKAIEQLKGLNPSPRIEDAVPARPVALDQLVPEEIEELTDEQMAALEKRMGAGRKVQGAGSKERAARSKERGARSKTNDE